MGPERHNPNDPDYIEQQEPNRFQDHKEDRRDRDRPRKDAMTKTKVEYNNPDTVVFGPGNMKPKVRPALRPRPNFGGGRRRPMHKKTSGMRPFGGQGGRPGRPF